jgi:hypothetical protein
MKKLIIVILVFALVGTAVFAQDAPGIAIGGWGRGAFMPLKYVDGDVGQNGAGTWMDGAAVGVSFSANAADKVGFKLDVRVNTGNLGNGEDFFVPDSAYIWTKPLNFLTIGVGAFHGPADWLRGKIGDFGEFAMAVGGVGGGEDQIFTRFQSGNGALVALTPIEGLTIGAVFNGDSGSTASLAVDEDAFKKLQIGAGYQIGNIGLVRAQFVGNVEGGGSYTQADGIAWGNSNRIEAAFALTAIDGLTLDIGGKVPLKYSENAADFQAPFSLSVGANFGLGDFSIGGRVDSTFAGSYEIPNFKYTPGIGIVALVEPSFNLGSFVVGGDVRLGFAGADKVTIGGNSTTGDTDLSAGLGAWIGLNYSNGSFKAGVAAQLPLNDHVIVFSIPVVLEYWF